MDESTISPRVLRIAEQAKTALARLNSDERLSNILPQARALCSGYGEPKHTFWLDLEIYGYTAVPGTPLPLKEKYQKEGLFLFMELRSVENIDELRADDILSSGYVRNLMPQRDLIATKSIGEIEREVAAWQPPDRLREAFHTADDVLRYNVVQRENQRILDRVRAYLHNLVSNILYWAEGEKENQALVGRDYHIVIDSLHALQTDVGQELEAALDNLKSDNPAQWALTALGCRNVILELGRTLFPVREDTYYSELLRKSLELKGEREKNRLTAFVDWHWTQADDSVKKELEGLPDLIERVYSKGSQGKRSVRHADAQRLIVDTFELVASLERLVGLEPIQAEHSNAG